MYCSSVIEVANNFDEIVQEIASVSGTGQGKDLLTKVFSSELIEYFDEQMGGGMRYHDMDAIFHRIARIAGANTKQVGA